MKKVVFLSLIALCMMGCDDEQALPIEDNTTIEEKSQIIGDWELYRAEKHDLHMEFDDGQLVTSMKWIDVTSTRASEMTLEFDDDNTFENYYAGVKTHEGTWGKINDKTFDFTFSENAWSDMTNTYTVNVHCNNTISIKYRVNPPAGNHKYHDDEWYYIQYYRTPGTSECDDWIDYYVE